MHCGAAHFMFVNIIRSVFLFFSHKNVLLKIKEMQGHKFSFWLCFYHVNKVNYADNCSPKMSLKPHVYWTFSHVFSICCITISFWVVTKVVSLLLRRFVFRIAEASAKRVTGDEPQGTMGRVQTAGEASARSCVVFLAKKSFSWHGLIFGLFKSWKGSVSVAYCCKHCKL